jgi:hypothetical protein
MRPPGSPMTGPTAPPCFTPEELASWTEANAQCGTRYMAASPCEDCLEEFWVEMRRIGLCPMTTRPPTCNTSDWIATTGGSAMSDPRITQVRCPSSARLDPRRTPYD